MSTETVTIFGATGAQGGAVLDALSHDPTYHVRAVTRNPKASTSKKLREFKHVEVVEADMNDINSVRTALTGADTCFLVTVTYFRGSNTYNEELQQGKNVADVCKELGIKKVIYSTFDPEWKQPTGVSVNELDHKIEIYNYMISIDLPVVGVMMGFYYENILNVFKPSKLDQDTYGFGLPLGDSTWYLVSVKDIGPVVHEIMRTWSHDYVGEIVPIIKEAMTLQGMCDVINKFAQPITFLDLKVTPEKFQELTEKGPRQEDVSKLFEVVCKATNRPTNDKMDCLKFHPKMVSFDDWVKDHVHILEDIADG